LPDFSFDAGDGFESGDPVGEADGGAVGLFLRAFGISSE
jgi:hypothetical protein